MVRLARLDRLVLPVGLASLELAEIQDPLEQLDSLVRRVIQVHLVIQVRKAR